MVKTIPRVILAGTNSGCGKTTVTCAVLQALVNRHMKVGAFKCGPDYIDTMFHSRIIGAKSSNLDLFFFKPNIVRYLLAKNARDLDISIIEGVMGYYDGMGLTTTKASTYEVSKETSSPTVLVVGARGAALSVLATIQGFASFYCDHQIRGVILNQCSPMSYPILAQAITERFNGRIKPLGYLPPMSACELESRHLGLVTAAEITDLKEKLQLLAGQAEKSIDLDGILSVASDAPSLTFDPISVVRYPDSVKIAVAEDKAFCFYYHDNLEVLREMGAEIVPFSPLTDKELPTDIHGIYLGGGYPELYASELSQNDTMLQSVRNAVDRGIPCIAECGGFMYLTEQIGEYPMVGVLGGKCFDTGRLIRFGYVDLMAEEDNLLCKAGESIPAHEFHHWDCTAPGTSFIAQKPSGRKWSCIVSNPRLFAGYPHLHFYANLNFAKSFYEVCIKEKDHDREY